LLINLIGVIEQCFTEVNNYLTEIPNLFLGARDKIVNSKCLIANLYKAKKVSTHYRFNKRNIEDRYHLNGLPSA
jgi:hypothetical protein